MHCLLIAATAREIDPFIQHYRQSRKLLYIDMTIDILVTGIGLTSTVYHLSRQVQLRKPDLVVQAGVAGCFDTRVPLGTVVAVKQEAIADESVVEIEKLKTLFDLKLVPHNQAPYKKGWLINPGKTLLKRTRLKMVKGITVNQISHDKKMIRFYRDYFNPVTESMEGAALHYVCLMEHIPFLQIRGLSNYIGERNKKKWNMQDSIMNLNRELIRLLESL